MIKLIFFVYAVYLLQLFEIVENRMRIDLIRQKSPRHVMYEYGDSIPWFADMQKPKPKPPRNSTNGTIPIWRYLDSEFYGIVYAGYHNQSMNVVFDLSWTTSWLMSKDCPTLLPGCAFHNKYNHDKSRTYIPTNDTFFVDEGKYNLSGYFSIDDINIGQIRVNKQRFVEMTNVPVSFAASKADGVMGMSLPYGKEKTFFMNMLDQNKIKKPVFSIYLNRDRNSERGGHIYLGFVNAKHVHQNDEFTYVQVTGEYGLWEFAMDGVFASYNKTDYNPICIKNCVAFFDTSITTIAASKEEIENINQQIHAKPFQLGRFSVDCETIQKLPKIRFVIKNKNFTLSYKHYIQKTAVGPVQVCLSAFIESNSEFENGKWVLGGAFLSHFYTSYDMKKLQIGIVTAA